MMSTESRAQRRGWEVVVPATLLERVRVVCLLLALSSTGLHFFTLVTLHGSATASPLPPAATGILALWWLLVYLRRGAPMWTSPLEAVALLGAGLGSPQPSQTLGIFFAGVLFRSLYGGVAQSLALVAADATAFAVVTQLQVNISAFQGRVIALVVGPGLVVIMLSARGLIAALSGHERALERQRALAEAGSQLLAAESVGALWDLACVLAARLVAHDPCAATAVACPTSRSSDLEIVSRAGSSHGALPALGETLPADASDATVARFDLQSDGTAVSSLLVTAKPRVLREALPSLRSAAVQVSLAAANVQLRAALQTKVMHDGLTGLFSRGHFCELLAQAAMAVGGPGQLAVLYLDLDDFKTINDALGHAAGDAALIEVAKQLRRAVGEHPTARLGGDEFAVLVHHAGAVQCADDLVSAISRVLKAPLLIAERRLHVRTSIGIALGGPGSDAEGLLRDADIAMYVAKRRGKRHHEVFDSAMRLAAAGELQLREDLELAVVRHQLVLHFQPLVVARDAAVYGFECLLRWQHPRRGLLGPDQFIPYAEAAGLLVDMECWALHEACAQAVRWRPAAGSCAPLVGVNLCAQHVQHPDVIDHVRAALRSSGLAADRLVIEVTETALLEHLDTALRHLTAIRDLGVRVSLDDFGTGYSSLSYLTLLPLDSMKIDRSFLTGSAQALLRPIAEMGHALHLRIVAEGVEDGEQAALLGDLGCDLLQGFWFSRPVPASEVPALLARPSLWPSGARSAATRTTPEHAR